MMEKILVGLIAAAAAGFVVYWLIRSLRGDKCQCPSSSGCPYSGNCPGADRCHHDQAFKDEPDQE